MSAYLNHDTKSKSTEEHKHLYFIIMIHAMARQTVSTTAIQNINFLHDSARPWHPANRHPRRPFPMTKSPRKATRASDQSPPELENSVIYSKSTKTESARTNAFKFPHTELSFIDISALPSRRRFSL